jgi:hypothetical protein
MTEDLSRAYRQALDAAAGDDPWSTLRRASLEALAAQVPGLAPEQPLPLTMHLVDPDSADHLVPAAKAGEMLERLQRAVARVAKARRTHALEVKRILKADVEAARLNVVAAGPGSLTVELRPHLHTPSADEQEEEIPLGTSTWAEQAMIELIRVLPESRDDEAAVDSIPAADPVLRRAINDLVTGKGGQLDVDFALERPDGAQLFGQLSRAQAAELRKSLDISTEERTIEIRRGRLDGLRTKRRLFYLEVPGGAEIHGLVDEDLLTVVRDNLDRVVNVRLEVLNQRSRSGRATQKRYRLIGVYDEPEQLLPEELRELPPPPRELPPGRS